MPTSLVRTAIVLAATLPWSAADTNHGAVHGDVFRLKNVMSSSSSGAGGGDHGEPNEHDPTEPSTPEHTEPGHSSGEPSTPDHTEPGDAGDHGDAGHNHSNNTNPHGAGAGGHGGGGHGEHHSHPHVAILFVFMVLGLGAFTMHFLSRFLPGLPYTPVLLVEGFLMGYINAKKHNPADAVGFFGDFSTSLEMWSNIDPHLLLFAFLPALLFADCMGLNWEMWKKCLGQCLVLAGPGVLMGTGLTACVGKYIFAHGWSWEESLLFGSILAATDPVAVVSILKELGVSDKLTMCVSGESLLNDGTAIVLFNLFKALAINTPKAMKVVYMTKGVTAFRCIRYFCWVAGGGLLLGFFFGVLAVIWLRRASTKTSHEDPIIQTAITLCLAYMSFFVAEHFMGVSGVLATVAAALCIASSGWTYFVQRETMHAVWHMIEYVFNTLIFFLAGSILGNNMGHRSCSFSCGDFSQTKELLILYILCMMIRFFMVMCFYPFISRMGYGFSKKEVCVLSWGGLRGAVGLALAIDADLAFDGKASDIWNVNWKAKAGRDGGCKALMHNLADCKANCQYLEDTLHACTTDYQRALQYGEVVLFHVGGIAMMTLLINGVTSGALVSMLGMAATDEYRTSILNDVDRRIHDTCVDAFKAECDLVQLNEAERKVVHNNVHALQSPETTTLHEMTASQTEPRRRRGSNAEGPGKMQRFFVKQEPEKLQAKAFRELYLAMLRSKYLALEDRGVLTQQGQVATILNQSVDLGKESIDTKLSDWRVIYHTISPTKKRSTFVPGILDCLRRCRCPMSTDIEEFFATANLVIRPQTMCIVLLCFIQAHKETKAAFSELLAGDDGGEEAEFEEAAEQLVLSEVDKEIAEAENLLATINTASVQNAKIMQVENVVLECQRCFILKLVEEGALQEKEGHNLLHHMTAHQRHGHGDGEATDHSDVESPHPSHADATPSSQRAVELGQMTQSQSGTPMSNVPSWSHAPQTPMSDSPRLVAW